MPKYSRVRESNFAGLAEAHLSTGYVFEFSENMVQGRGFTAVTAIVFGASRPLWTFLASFLFGLSDALAFRLHWSDLACRLRSCGCFPTSWRS